jgi:hypothetical protein
MIAISSGLMIHWFCLGDLSANRLPQKRNGRGAAALYSPSGHKTTSKSNVPFDDIRRRVARSHKGGYVGCATDASVGGKRLKALLVVERGSGADVADITDMVQE